MQFRLFLLLASFLFYSAAACAQPRRGDTVGRGGYNVIIGGLAPTPIGKGYWGNSYDAAILSTAAVIKHDKSKLTTPRFTYVLNFGFNYNYDFSRAVGLFTGFGIKNIGFIDKVGDSTIKRRVYAVGAPLAIKIGNLQKRNFFFLGGGVDVPFNYREKGFVKRNDKQKFSEWFSDRTPAFMPYVFAGISINPGVILKAQYYPGNFLNTDYTETVGGVAYQPYSMYQVNIMYLSLGVDIHYKKLPKENYDDANKAPANGTTDM